MYYVRQITAVFVPQCALFAENDPVDLMSGLCQLREADLTAGQQQHNKLANWSDNLKTANNNEQTFEFVFSLVYNRYDMSLTDPCVVNDHNWLCRYCES